MELKRYRSKAHPQKVVLIRDELILYSNLTNDDGYPIADSKSTTVQSREAFLSEFEEDVPLAKQRT